MSREWEGLPTETQDALNQLLRDAAPKDPDLTWPDVNSLWSFAQGSADEATRERVQAALANSSELRGYLTQLAAADQPLTASEAAALENLQVPDAAPLVARLGLASPRTGSTAAPSLWSRVREFLVSPLPAYALTAAMAVLLLVRWGEPGTNPIQPMQALSLIAVDAADPLRGSGPEVAVLSADPVALTVWLPVEGAPDADSRYHLEVATGDDQLLEDLDLPAPALIDGGWACVVTVHHGSLPAGELRFTVVREHPQDGPRRFEVRVRH